MEILVGLLGICVFIFIAWLASSDRKMIRWRIVFWGLGLQFFFAILILPGSFLNRGIRSAFNLRIAPGGWLFEQLNTGINSLLAFTNKGTDFLIQSTQLGSVGLGFENFIFRVLPTILFFSALMAILYHLGIVQRVVSVLARVMAKTMGTSGAESLSAAANIFVGQTEAPLVVRPYVNTMTKSELLAIMTGGMATVAGGILAAYVAFLSEAIPDIAGHLMAASVMSAPAALMIAKILIPETQVPETGSTIRMSVEKNAANVIDAAAQGAADGLTLAMNVGAMLLVFIALIAVINAPFELFGEWIGIPLSLEIILGKLFSPVAFIMGVPWEDASAIGALLGKKTVINEFVAFYDLSQLVKEGTQLSERSMVIATYALCGFSNFSSIAIQIGGIGGIAPGRKGDLARLGLKALLGGSLACFLTASVAGILTVGYTSDKSLFTNDKTTEVKKVSQIRFSFFELRNSLTGETLPEIQAKQWQRLRNGIVEWSGIVVSTSENKDNREAMVYFGFKDKDELTGKEPASYVRLQLGKEIQEMPNIMQSIKFKGRLVGLQSDEYALFRINALEWTKN
ncbi:MAG: hypothetical protein KDK38_13335 [Leptospiraceae bacterium]|nr:hypothetical protein [Leptospiraceae bacterium]